MGGKAINPNHRRGCKYPVTCERCGAEITRPIDACLLYLYETFKDNRYEHTIYRRKTIKVERMCKACAHKEAGGYND